MMKHTITLICSLLFLLQGTSAQVFNDSPVLKQYDKESIFLQGNRAYVKNGVQSKVGFLYRNLEQEMELSSVATMEYAKAKNSKNIARIAGIAAGAIYIVPLLGNSNNFFNKSENVLLWGIGTIAAYSVSLQFNMKSRNEINRAIWYRNRDVLLLVD